MAIALTEPLARLRAGLRTKVRQSADILRQDGPFRLLELSAASLSEPVRALQLRANIAADAKRAMAKLKDGKRGRGLFIDCGSNIGQGYKFFRRYYTPNFYDYILVEPNPHCLPYLEALRLNDGARIEIIGKAAGVKDGHAELFGPPASRWNPTYEGFSIVREHNCQLYEPEASITTTVQTFSLAQLINDRQAAYDFIVMKMDIEGAEYEILTDIICAGAHFGIHAAYIEFHSLYMKKEEREQKRIAEREIRHVLQSENILLRGWI